MRDIKFRAKRLDNGEWVFGFLFKTKDTCYIAYDEQYDDDLMYSPQNIFIPVDPETVGQYTGLRDKNGLLIYEGDIVEAWSEGSHANFEVRWRQEALPCWILYPNGKFNQLWKLHGSKHVSGFYYDTVEIVGNIHDKPELLKS